MCKTWKEYLVIPCLFYIFKKPGKNFINTMCLFSYLNHNSQYFKIPEPNQSQLYKNICCFKSLLKQWLGVLFKIYCIKK